MHMWYYTISSKHNHIVHICSKVWLFLYINIQHTAIIFFHIYRLKLTVFQDSQFQSRAHVVLES